MTEAKICVFDSDFLTSQILHYISHFYKILNAYRYNKMFKCNILHVLGT